MKIRTKLIISYCLLIGLILSLSLISLLLSQHYLQVEAGKSSVLLAEEMVRRLDYGLYLRKDNLHRYADTYLVTDCSEQLKSIFIDYFEVTRGYNFFNRVYITDHEGTVICSSQQDDINTDASQESWWKKTREEGEYVGTELYEPQAAGSEVLISVRIENDAGEFIGVLATSIPLTSLLREAEVLIKRYETSEVQLITEQGYLLYESNAFRFMERIDDTALFSKLGRQSGYFISEENRKKKLISYAHSRGYGSFAGLDWILILKHGVTDVLRGTIVIGRILTAATILIFIIAIVVSLIIARSITKPINLLHIAAEKVAGGDLSYRIDLSSRDEISEFARTFNIMTKRLQTLYTDLEDEILSRKQTESELAKINRDLDDFAYIVSHDLREPLRGIRSYSELLLSEHTDLLNEEGKELVQTLMRLSNRLENLIQSLLSYSRAGRFEFAFKNADIGKIVEETVDSLSIFLKENNAEVIIRDELPTITCDPVRTGEIFYNLITNGIKYNESDLKKVEVGYTEGSTGPVFYVRDNGIGIREKHKESIFRIFKRLHPRDRYGGGTGSGLTIVKKLIERHGGSIWLESEYGKGSTFYFTLQEGLS